MRYFAEDSKALPETFESVYENGVLWNSKNFSFNTAKTSHRLLYENESQKNTVAQR